MLPRLLEKRKVIETVNALNSHVLFGSSEICKKTNFTQVFFEKHQAHESIDGMNSFTCPCKVSRGFSRKVRTHVVYVQWIWNNWNLQSSSWCWRMDVLVSGRWSLKQEKSSDLQNQKQMELSFFLSCSFPPAIQEPVCMRLLLLLSSLLLLLLLPKTIQSNVFHSSWQLGHVSRVELFVIGH